MPSCAQCTNLLSSARPPGGGAVPPQRFLLASVLNAVPSLCRKTKRVLWSFTWLYLPLSLFTVIAFFSLVSGTAHSSLSFTRLHLPSFASLFPWLRILCR